jgi:hypothetical protein
MVTAFRGAIEFFDRLGVYDVVLPFLLIFTIFFAMLERTKVFGTEKIGGVETTKKNLNAMASFVIALVTVASTRIVAVINEGLAKVALLLVMAISFLILAGSFYVNEDFKLSAGWKQWGTVFMAFGIILIFAYQVGWLAPFWSYVTANWNSTVIGSVVLIALIVWFMTYVTKPEVTAEKQKEGTT